MMTAMMVAVMAVVAMVTAVLSVYGAAARVPTLSRRRGRIPQCGGAEEGRRVVVVVDMAQVTFFPAARHRESLTTIYMVVFKYYVSLSYKILIVFFFNRNIFVAP